VNVGLARVEVLAGPGLREYTQPRPPKVASPQADTTGQSGRSFVRDDAQTLLQGKDADEADTGITRFIANAPKGDDAEERGDALAPPRRRPAPIDIVIEFHQLRDLAEIGRFEMVVNPLHDDSANVAQQFLQITFEGMAGDRRDGAPAKSHDP